MKHLSRHALLLVVLSLVLAGCASPTPAPTQPPQPTAPPTQAAPAAPTKAPPTVPPAAPTAAPTAVPTAEPVAQPTAIPAAKMPVRPTGEVWNQIEKAGVLRVATAADYAPFTITTKTLRSMVMTLP